MMNFTTTSSRPFSAPALSPKRSPGARLVLSAIRLYQRFTAGRIAPCRFYPSCSQYASEAVEIHGAWRGTGLALRRLGRCRPFGPHGVDLVPTPKRIRSSQP
jgi:putative membrane protein insertion efficiency factor